MEYWKKLKFGNGGGFSRKYIFQRIVWRIERYSKSKFRDKRDLRKKVFVNQNFAVINLQIINNCHLVFSVTKVHINEVE